MFSGAKHKLKQWRQRKAPTKMSQIIPKDTFYRKLENSRKQLEFLQNESSTIIKQLLQQSIALSEIDEDTSAVREKIDELKKVAAKIEIGLQEAEEIRSFFETVDILKISIIKNESDIEDLKHQASKLSKENRKLRTELQVFQDHQERSECRLVELEVQIEHLKFMNTLPDDYKVTSFWRAEETEENSVVEKTDINPLDCITFLQEDESLEDAGAYILQILSTLDFSDDSRLRILIDLIKPYFEAKLYEVVIPILKTTIEDLGVDYNPHERIMFTMMEAMVIIYKMTGRFKDALDLQTEILQIRKDCMSTDRIGLAQTLSSLAYLHTKIGKVKAARVFCREALDLKYQVFGEEGLETGKELHNMGVLYSYDLQYKKALDCMLTAFTIIRVVHFEQRVSCLGTVAANVATVHILNDELFEAKCAFKSTLKFLHRNLEKILDGKNISKEDILSDENLIEQLPDNEYKKEIKRITSLILEINKKAESVSHATSKDPNAVEKYSKFNDSTSDEE